MRDKDYYYRQWKDAEKEGKTHCAKVFKDKYMCLVMKAPQEPYTQYIYVLKGWLPIYLN